MLTRVTFTGADDTVNVADLFDISRQYGFVEWGILIGSHSGESRFPSFDWIESLHSWIGCTTTPPLLSLHVCGLPLRMLVNGNDYPLSESRRKLFDRMQLNFHGEPVTRAQSTRLIDSLLDRRSVLPEVIVQLDGVNDFILDRCMDLDLNASGLYDGSHGAGIRPEKWPAPHKRWRVGYAGGIGPETIHDDIRAIEAAATGTSYWIDMETKVRSQRDGRDVFDLEKCVSVLEAVIPYINRP